MAEETKTVLEAWQEVKALVEQLDVDVTKNVDKMNVTAGVRVRAGSRALRKLCVALGKATLVADKTVKETRKAAKKEKK